MPLDPTDFRTWTQFEDHPIFGPGKCSIAEWSLDPTQYCEASSYSKFMPEWYVHVDPAPPVDEQKFVAARDIANLAEASRRIIETYGPTAHELVILDDFTAYTWLKNDRFYIREIYPMLPSDGCILMMFIESPVIVDELRCTTLDDLMQQLHSQIEI